MYSAFGIKVGRYNRTLKNKAYGTRPNLKNQRNPKYPADTLPTQSTVQKQESALQATSTFECQKVYFFLSCLVTQFPHALARGRFSRKQNTSIYECSFDSRAACVLNLLEHQTSLLNALRSLCYMLVSFEHSLPCCQ